MLPSSASPSTHPASSSYAVASPPLAPLKPIGMTPEVTPATLSPLERLQAIERIDVTKVADQMDLQGKNQKYSIAIFLREAAVNKQKPRVGPSTTKDSDLRQPDFQVVHTVSQFCSLRNHVHSCVQTSHGSRCQFCVPLNRFVTFGDGQALAFAALAFTPAADASALLTRFLNTIVLERPFVPEVVQRSECRGQQQLPHWLHAFLFRSS